MKKLSMEELDRKSVSEFKDAEKFPVVAVLENIRSAYNVGSVFRTADAFLLESIFITGYTATPPHKQITKTALGAEEAVSWKKFATGPEAVHALKEHGYKVYAVEQVEHSISLNDFTDGASEKTAFVFGNEVNGVEEDTLKVCDGCIEIPQFGTKHSLNIAVAAGIVLWEAAKACLGFDRKK